MMKQQQCWFLLFMHRNSVSGSPVVLVQVEKAEQDLSRMHRVVDDAKAKTIAAHKEAHAT